MEYEIPDNPEVDYDHQGEIIEHHVALKNQSAVKAEDYPAKDRKHGSLTGPKKRSK